MQKCMLLGCDHAVLQGKRPGSFSGCILNYSLAKRDMKTIDQMAWNNHSLYRANISCNAERPESQLGHAQLYLQPFLQSPRNFWGMQGLARALWGQGKIPKPWAWTQRCCIKNWGHLGAGSLEKVTPFVIARQVLHLEEQTASRFLVCQQCVWRVLNHLLLYSLEETHSARLCGLTLLLIIAGWHTGSFYLEFPEDKGGLPSTDCVFQCQLKSSIGAGCGSDTEGSKTTPAPYFFIWKQEQEVWVNLNIC